MSAASQKGSSDEVDSSISGSRHVTDEDYDVYLRGRAAGMTAERAARQLGFSKQTMYEWQQRNPDKWEEFKARLRAPMLDQIIRHSKKQWQPAAWFLERSFPNEFALTEVHRIQHSGTVEHKFQMVDRTAIEELSGTLREVESEVCNP